VTGNPLLDLVALPVASGLFGFIEPCSIGATLIFIKVLEGKSAAEKLAQASLPSSLRQRAERLTGWLRCRAACPSGGGSC